MRKLSLVNPSGKNEGGKAMIKNLEQLDIEELGYLYAMIDADPIEIASDLFPDQPRHHRSVIDKIGQWVINRKTVLEFTAEDKPEIAVIFKKACFRIWQQLPEYARSVKVRVE
jgi:hypothetical protein